MEFNHDNVRRRVVEEEDRLSSLPDDLIHKILSCFDMKFAVQTCLLSSKWKLLWTSMPCLNFSSGYFGCLDMKFDNFVTHVLSHRNNQIEVSSVKLNFCGVKFRGAVNKLTVEKIASYAFSHNVQQLTITNTPISHSDGYPPCLLSSQSLKHFTFTSSHIKICSTIKTPFDFPALTTLNLSFIRLCGDVFSKCVNLRNLTLMCFQAVGMEEEAFDIIGPRLSNLMLISSNSIKTINLLASQLENLSITNCSIEYLNASPGLSSLCYTSYLWYDGVVQFSNDRFHSLNKVSISFSMFKPHKVYKAEDARKTINMLEELHSARYLTLNADTVECISAFPDLLLHHSSPFSNLICLTIDSSMRKDAYETTMSSEAKAFFLESSPNATLIMKSPNRGSK